MIAEEFDKCRHWSIQSRRYASLPTSFILKGSRQFDRIQFGRLGGILSPMVFTIYTADLENWVKKSKVLTMPTTLAPALQQRKKHTGGYKCITKERPGHSKIYDIQWPCSQPPKNCLYTCYPFELCYSKCRFSTDRIKQRSSVWCLLLVNYLCINQLD